MVDIEIANTSYLYKASIKVDLSKLAGHVEKMRKNGRLSTDELHRIRKFLNSNISMTPTRSKAIN